MKSCFGYVRVSSHRQGEGVSLDAQKDAILRFSGSNNITISQWFEEQQTAAKSGRPVFNSLLKALKAGKASGVVMHKIDRSARNFFDWAKIGELADSGINVHFATESLDFQSRGGRLTANIQMAVAEDYVRNLKAEIHKGQRGQLKRGYYPFKAPIGYRNNGGNELKTIDPHSGPLVKTAFELYATGQYSLHSLRYEMAPRGLHRSSGEPLSKGCVEKFLANPFYTGLIRIHRTGETYQGAHQPLIATALFQRVAEVRAGKSGKKTTRHNHLFRGLFRCATCRYSMIPEKQKAYVYYRCQSVACRGNSVREEPLDRAIAKVLGKIKLSPQHQTTINQRVEQWCRTKTNSGRHSSGAMQLAQVTQKITKLEDAAITGIIDADNFAKRKEKFLLEQAALNEKMETAATNRTDSERVHKFLERIKNLAEHYHFANPAEKRELVEIATSNRTVVNKNVTVEPSNWLRATEVAVGGFCCAQSPPTSRTSHEMPNQQTGAGLAEKTSDSEAFSEIEARHLEQVIEAANSPEAHRIYEMFMDGYRGAALGTEDCRANHKRL
uniref:recombinase family protein n=1 Tax=Pararhizobium sp. IMCC3301 TaxID=3067904 RepID=UPI002740864B|nr:recombinase family protein [Pararhizobium sp. IMCC3301]